MADTIEKRHKQEVSSASAEQLIEATNAYSPDVSIYDTPDALLFMMDIPGVSKGDVSLEMDENNVLIMRAKSSFQEPEGLVVRQFNTGNYFRAFTLTNEFDKDSISANLEEGVLKLRVPRKEEAKPRRIQINA